eukprot:2267023-Pyramimonas_sp.AAC.1
MYKIGREPDQFARPMKDAAVNANSGQRHRHWNLISRIAGDWALRFYMPKSKSKSKPKVSHIAG